MEHERLTIGILLEDTPVQALFIPFLESLGLVLGKVSPHGEISLGEVHRIFVGVSHNILFRVVAQTR